MENAKKRLTNLDLLKIVSMVMIVCTQYLNFGGTLKEATLGDVNYYTSWFAELLCVVGMNCFILCTVYVMSDNHFKFSKLAELWLEILFFNIVCFVLAAATGICEFSLAALIKCFLPITTNAYWYMTAFFIFYLLSPFLIFIAKKLSVKQLKMLAVTLVSVFVIIPWQWTKIDKGYHFVWLIILFFVSAYIKRADLFRRRVRAYFSAYLIIVLAMFAFKLLLDVLKSRIDLTSVFDVQSFNFALTFIASLALFAAFKNIKIKREAVGKALTFVSSLTLGVYLIHLNPFIYKWMWGELINSKAYINVPYFVFHMAGCVAGVYIVCSFIEYFRQLLFKLFSVQKFSDRAGDKLQTFADKLFSDGTIEKL